MTDLTNVGPVRRNPIHIAVPSMLSGCKVIPFSETTIEALQSHMAKQLLGVQFILTELGLKPFQMLLYQHQVNFYTRVMNLPKSHEESPG